MNRSDCGVALVIFTGRDGNNDRCRECPTCERGVVGGKVCETPISQEVCTGASAIDRGRTGRTVEGGEKNRSTVCLRGDGIAPPAKPISAPVIANGSCSRSQSRLSTFCLEAGISYMSANTLYSALSTSKERVELVSAR